MSWVTFKRELTTKEKFWKEASRSRQTSAEIDAQFTRTRTAANIRGTLDPGHFRAVTVVKDGGFLMDPKNVKVRVTTEKQADFYEDKRLPGYITTIPQLLKIARDKFQERKLEHVYTINGDKIESFGDLPDYMTEVVVSCSSKFIGITYGGANKRSLKHIRMQSSRRSTNSREYLKRPKSTASSLSNLNTRNSASKQIVNMKALKKPQENCESIENLRKDYPVDVIVKLLMKDKQAIPDSVETVLEISKKSYTDRLDKFLGPSKHDRVQVDLEMKNKYRHKYTNSVPVDVTKTPPKLTAQTSRKYIQENADSSSGFESFSDDDCKPASKQAEEIDKIPVANQPDSERSSFLHRIIVSKLRSSGSSPLKSISSHNLSLEYGLTREQFDTYYIEYSDLAYQSQNLFKNKLSLTEILRGDYDSEKKGIRIEYLLSKHSFFISMPKPLLECILKYFNIDNVITPEVWIYITSILIHKSTTRRIKIHFVQQFLPSRYKQVLALLRSTCNDKSRIKAFMIKLTSLHCFHTDFTLYRERLGSILTSSDLLVNDILDLLTSFVN
jgi:hypothetical protein